MLKKLDKKMVLSAFREQLGYRISSVEVNSDGSVTLDMDSGDILDSVSSLPMDKNGVFIFHDSCYYPNASSFEGQDMMEKLSNLQDSKNFGHLFRIMHAFKFLNDNVDELSVVADIGAGYCELPSVCQTSGKRYNYYCLEFDDKKLNTVAKRKIGTFNRVLVKADLSRGVLPFENGSLDAVICMELAEHIGKSQFLKLICSISRAMKEESVALITTPNVLTSRKVATDHIYEYTTKEFEEILDKSGLRIDRMFGFGCTSKITEIDQILSGNALYETMRAMWPSQVIKPLLLTDDIDRCRVSIFHCSKVKEPDEAAVNKIDFSESAKYNKKFRSRG